MAREQHVWIQGMTCQGCVQKVEHGLLKVAGVEQVSVDLESGQAVVRGSHLNPQELVQAITKSGFSAERVGEGDATVANEADETPSEEATDQHRASVVGESAFNGHGGKTDLLIIGGGSAAFAAAIRGEELGANVTLVNQGTIGGTCVNVGCIPSKTLIRAGEARYRAGHHQFAGIDGRSELVDFSAVIRQKDELVQSLRQAKYLDVLAAHEKVRLIEGEAKLTSPNEVEVNGEALRADRILIATGSEPWIPSIPGLREVSPLTSTSAFELDHLPESLIVLGGRYIALECAQMFARFGTKVTVLQRSNHLLPTEDPDLTERLADYLRAEGIDVRTGVQTEAVTRANGGISVKACIDEEIQTFTANEILCATGRRAMTESLAADSIGLNLGERGEVMVDDYLESNVSGIYAAGDVAGDPAYVYTAAYEGRLAADNALTGNGQKRDYTALPWVIFTDPQLAGVGWNERQAVQAGIPYEVTRLELSHVPRALAARDTRGVIKLLRNPETDLLLGAHILAPEGGDLIMEPTLALRHQITVSSLTSAFHPYLTQAEAIKLCAQTFGKDVRTLSCCSA